MMLNIDPSDSRPIWRQIEEGLRFLAASGVFAPGGPVPSVRELARDIRVNPATVSKAYQRLAAAGVLQVRRGEGTFVADEPPNLPPDERRRRLLSAARRFATAGAELGATRAELDAALDRALDGHIIAPGKSEDSDDG